MNIYLVQRGKILPEAKTDWANGKRLSEVVDLDYMGAAEFEFGALPAGLRSIERRRDNVKLSEVKETFEAPLFILHAFDDAALSEYLDLLLSHTKHDAAARTKEYTCFNKWHAYRHEQDIRKYFKVDFWWDIENDVMFSYDKDFMHTLEGRLSSSWEYMDSKKKATQPI